jgi:hypothetical protein
LQYFGFYLECDVMDFIKKENISATDQNSNKLTHNSKGKKERNKELFLETVLNIT